MLDVGDKDVSAKMGRGTQLTEESWSEHEVCSGFQQTLSPHCVLVVTKEPEREDTQGYFWHQLRSHIASCIVLFLICRNSDGHKDSHCRVGMDSQSCLWGEYQISMLQSCREILSL